MKYLLYVYNMSRYLIGIPNIIDADLNVKCIERGNTWTLLYICIYIYTYTIYYTFRHQKLLNFGLQTNRNHVPI